MYLDYLDIKKLFKSEELCFSDLKGTFKQISKFTTSDFAPVVVSKYNYLNMTVIITYI